MKKKKKKKKKKRKRSSKNQIKPAIKYNEILSTTTCIYEGPVGTEKNNPVDFTGKDWQRLYCNCFRGPVERLQESPHRME